MINKYLPIIGLLIILLLSGCDVGEGVPSAFKGGDIFVGGDHLTFDFSQATWSPGDDELVIDFQRASNWPNAKATISDISSIEVGDAVPCSFEIEVDQYTSYTAGPIVTGASVTITFSRLDLHIAGAVSGTIYGHARSVEHPGESPVSLTGSFKDIIVLE
ncbi:MAG: hypothetical protein ABIC40_01235 [bacterium]